MFFASPWSFSFSRLVCLFVRPSLALLNRFRQLSSKKKKQARTDGEESEDGCHGGGEVNPDLLPRSCPSQRKQERRKQKRGTGGSPASAHRNLKGGTINAAVMRKYQMAKKATQRQQQEKK